MTPSSGSTARPEHDVALVLILHDHQPVGNFEDVLRAAFRDAYAPFLEFVEAHPALRLALHTSGPLLEWLEAREPGYLDRLGALSRVGRIEPWGGAFYEPILPAIPESDRRGQILAMSAWLERRLGVRPRGLWLAERVWEPGLASSLVDAGVEYSALDDAHFVAAGLERSDLHGTYLTEDQGRALRLFPIHRELRYAIPFEEPEVTIEWLRGVAGGGPGRVAVLGDDGEKFGVWPGTRKRCYEEGWLERFVQALAAEPWIRLKTPVEVVASHPPLGIAYLPSASYHEMAEWSLPSPARERYEQAAATLATDGEPDGHDLLRGGHWRNFLARYPESNRLHKRMLRASRRLSNMARPGDPAWESARQHLWKSQCNCAYWHGVFGGLYLPHLRAAAYGELIAAERWDVEGARTERQDLDFDGWEDALLETRDGSAWISERGARLWALDDRGAPWNWIDTLAQRREPYHDRLAEAPAAGEEAETIHAGIKLKEPDLAERVAGFRPHDRDAFLDRWSEGASPPVEWSERRLGLTVEPQEVSASLAEDEAPALSKRFRFLGDGALEVRYRLASRRARRGTLEVEINVALHVAAAADRWIEVNGARATPPEPGANARHAEVTRSAFVDEWAGRRLEIETDRPASLSRAPIETVSLSESGAERVFQGVEAVYAFAASFEPRDEWTVTFTLRPRHRSAA